MLSEFRIIGCLDPSRKLLDLILQQRPSRSRRTFSFGSTLLLSFRPSHKRLKIIKIIKIRASWVLTRTYPEAVLTPDALYLLGHLRLLLAPHTIPMATLDVLKT